MEHDSTWRSFLVSGKKIETGNIMTPKTTPSARYATYLLSGSASPSLFVAFQGRDNCFFTVRTLHNATLHCRSRSECFRIGYTAPQIANTGKYHRNELIP